MWYSKNYTKLLKVTKKFFFSNTRYLVTKRLWGEGKGFPHFLWCFVCVWGGISRIKVAGHFLAKVGVYVCVWRG